MARPALPDGPYLVVGLARSGLAAADQLARRGAAVIGCDAGTPEVPRRTDVEWHLGTDGVDLLDRVRTVIKSPGVPAGAPAITEARRRGTVVIGELELAWRLLPNRFVAVTGTNGKTTTVELLGAIWRSAGLPVRVAGNVGRPLSSLVGEIGPEVTVVCEASSFQLEDSPEFAPDVAILLNLEEDHLDRHGDMAGYAEAKARIFANQGPDDVAVLPMHLAPLNRGRGQPLDFDVERELEPGSLSVAGERLEAAEIRLRGAHNLENAAAAATAALACGVPAEAVIATLRSFEGVEHRLESVATVGGVRYVNDSKATNPASAVRGLEAFETGVHAILGGSLKDGGFESLRRPLAERCRAAYLIGEAQSRLAEDLEGAVPLVLCGTLERALDEASGRARAGDVVLLSPACASFDAFADYEERGRRFKDLVAALGERE